MQATHFLVFASNLFDMFGHQNILASIASFVAPECSNCILSSNVFLNSVGTIIRSSLYVRAHLLASFPNAGLYASRAVFFSPRLFASLTRLSLASVATFVFLSRA